MSVSVLVADPPRRRLPMRPCVGIALFNAEGRVWLGRRQPKWARSQQDYFDGPIWQLPQGGIDKGERAHDAAFRELFEETGITSAKLIAEIPGWLSFELPRELVGVALKGKFSGQRLRWFAMRFVGEDDEITIKPKGPTKPEFDAWRWADLAELPALAIPFKRRVYQEGWTGSRRSRAARPQPAPALMPDADRQLQRAQAERACMRFKRSTSVSARRFD